MEESEKMVRVGNSLRGFLWFYPSEVRKAKADVDVLMCGRDAFGNQIYRDRARLQHGYLTGIAKPFIDEMRKASNGSETEDAQAQAKKKKR